MNEKIKKSASDMDLPPAATAEMPSEAEEKLGIHFPSEYREFFMLSNGAEGGVGKASYLVL